jgi:hypothetical protein
MLYNDYKRLTIPSIPRERDRAIQQAAGPAFVPQRTDGPRFTGGGFNLQQSSKLTA